MAKKKDNLPALTNNLSKIITSLNFAHLEGELADQLNNLISIENVDERQKMRFGLTKNIYTSIFNEIINKILFSENFMEEIDKLSIDKKLDILLKISKFNYDELMRENQKLNDDNIKYQVIINQTIEQENKKKISLRRCLIIIR